MHSHNVGVSEECGSGSGLGHYTAFYQEGLSKTLVRLISVMTDSNQV
jgi:hypothetical protein